MPLELERNPEFSLSFIRFNIQIYLWKTVKLSLSNYHKRDFFPLILLAYIDSCDKFRNTQLGIFYLLPIYATVC